MKKLLVASAMITSTAGLQAEEFFQASLTPDLAIHAKTTRINGIALNFWGENPQYSLNVGLVNGSTGDSKGLSWAFIANYADSYTGVAWAPVNFSRQEFMGWQAGLADYSQGTFTGLQSGFINVAEELHGLQVGVVNYSENLHGVQIGFINVAENNPWFTEFPDRLATGFPIVNWSF